VTILFNAFLLIFNDPTRADIPPFKMKKRNGKSGKKALFPKIDRFNMMYVIKVF
jgi:hypothetical protein